MGVLRGGGLLGWLLFGRNLHELGENPVFVELRRQVRSALADKHFHYKEGAYCHDNVRWVSGRIGSTVAMALLDRWQSSAGTIACIASY